MDSECKGTRICESGQCVEPAAPASAAPTPSAPATTTPAPASATAPAAAPAPIAPEFEKPFLPPEKRLHSKGMMVGGIVVTALAPVALFVTMVAGVQKAACRLDNATYTYSTDASGNTSYGQYQYRDCSTYDPVMYGALVSAGVFLGVGIPMIIVGAKREPVRPAAAATLTPWVSPSTAGLSLRLRL